MAFWRKVLAQKSALVLIAANLVPVWGVILAHWSVFSVVFLFWMENVIIGFFNLLKMLTVGAIGGAKDATVEIDFPGAWRVWRILRFLGALFLCGFFALHYGGFCFVHGMFVVGLLGGAFKSGAPDMLLTAIRDALTGDLGIAIAVLFFSHAFSFVSNFLIKREYAKVRVDSLMAAPYGRVIVLHMAILLGAFVSLALKSPMGILLLLVAMKIVLDLRFHLKERESGAVTLFSKKRVSASQTP